jgi:autotransporter-associated beta strand protein
MLSTKERRDRTRRALLAPAAAAATLAVVATPMAFALNGGPLRVTPRNGWRAFEVISIGNDPAGDGFTYAMPGAFDGIGAWSPDPATLRLSVNHETGDASVSEVNLNLTNFRSAIANTLATNSTGGVSFVSSARQAYGRWSNDGGGSFSATSDNTTTAFQNFCSGQMHPANTFGPGRGFVDNIYMHGEEVSGGRIFALDLANRDYYRLGSATVGLAPGGAGTATTGGMPADPWENAALLDTGDTTHVALLLSPDGGSQIMQLYIGEKGKDKNGAASSSFLARNGLAYGNFYYHNGSMPSGLTTNTGTIDNTSAGGLTSAKLEDVDTNPNHPTQAVIGVQESGLFKFDFNLAFNGAGGTFNPAGSGFSLTKVLNHVNDTDGQFGDADNVDWTESTTLNNVAYPDGLIFVNEDSGTTGGETWMTTSAGAGPTLIADTIASTSATETSGVLDISRRVGYRPGSVLLTNNQGADASMTVLINPAAALEPKHWDVNGMTSGAGGSSPGGAWNGVALNFNTDSTGGGAGILVADTTTLDTVVFAAGADATDGYTVTLTGTRAAGRVVVEQGNVTFTGGTLASGVFDVFPGAAATVASTLAGAAGGSVTKNGAGTLTVSSANAYAGGTTVTAGTLVLANADATAGGSVNIADGALAQAQAGLSKAITVTTLATNATGKFDLTDNSMVIKGLDATQVRGLINGAFNAGHWNGATGLDSSTAGANAGGTTAIGYGTAGFLNKSSFKGVSPLNTTDVLVKYTYYGDSDLSGATNLDDFTLFLGGYQNSGTTWAQGDYDYSGLVTLDDFTLFLKGYQQQGAPLSELEALIDSVPMTSGERAAMLAAVQAVPEPATAMAAVVLSAICTGLRKRRTH